MTAIVKAATLEAEIQACHPVMQELRTELSEEDFLERVRSQREDGHYHLVFLEEFGVPVCVAGYRITSNLSAGKHLYVDDLVTTHEHRHRGMGQAMLAWLEEEARRNGCTSMHLDSGVQRHPAHRLYIGAGMDIVYYHFRKPLD